MEIKKDNKIVITGKNICLVAGILCVFTAFYWLVQALFFDNFNLPMLMVSACLSLYLIIFSQKK